MRRQLLHPAVAAAVAARARRPHAAAIPLYLPAHDERFGAPPPPADDDDEAAVDATLSTSGEEDDDGYL
ncbi:hypothetical protein [Devosia sp.]|uniref:hypothetical protein n=1 Tax=Devosia sp. TaxID=1871048 RepID=UPI002EE0DDAF